MNQEKIGNFIKELRKKNNLTQAEFAKKYGVTYQAVSKWENGKNLPDMTLIKQICLDFNIDISELLNGEYKDKKNSNKLIIFFLIIILLLSVLLCVSFIKKNSNFEFKTLSTTCENFNISGSIAYNENKSSIYISNINYCGGNDEEIYKNIECSLYETHDNVSVKISSYSNKNNIKLEDYLKDLTITVDNYNKMCKNYEQENLYLEINATDKNNKITTYKIPLSPEKKCIN